MHYIDLNMVRAGVVDHPAHWRWCGYQEIAGLKQRYRILEMRELLQFAGVSNHDALSVWYDVGLNHTLRTASGCREPHWTESIAVGSQAFVERIAALSKGRKKLKISKWADDAWYVRDPEEFYGPVPMLTARESSSRP